MAHIGPFAGYSTYKCCLFGTPALVYIRESNPLATKLRFCLVRPHMMPTKTSVGPNEVVRLEVLRLAPPLLAVRLWALDKALHVG